MVHGTWYAVHISVRQFVGEIWIADCDRSTSHIVPYIGFELGLAPYSHITYFVLVLSSLPPFLFFSFIFFPLFLLIVFVCLVCLVSRLEDSFVSSIVYFLL